MYILDANLTKNLKDKITQHKAVIFHPSLFILYLFYYLYTIANV